MINPYDVNLIIFDMDGTIIASLPAVYESIKRAFKKIGWPVTFSAQEINKFFGITTASTKGSLYEFITPPGSHLSLEEVRERVRAEYKGTFRDMLEPFPGVKETLATLRKRGYKLAQYTNATTMYLDIVMSTLGIREYYDHIECVQDNGLTKTQLVQKIRDKFGGLKAAVVGDRVHDIEAARETGSLSVGVMFGYGGDEPKQADITIDKFDDLLSIFDRRLPIFELIMDAIKNKKQADKAFVIGVNGIDCSGKSAFANALEEYLKLKGHQTQLIQLDDFHNPRKIRYAGKDQAENYFKRSFNTELIVEKLLLPVSRKKDVSTNLTLLNVDSDKYDIVRDYSVNRNTIVIFEGVFIFRQELAPYIDYKVFLDITFDECKKRAGVRDIQASVEKYDVKYIPAQLKYLGEYPPHQTSDLVIDNTDWEYPKITSSRER
jgi:HAD superfamily hydrolase (TIGR01549 family)